MLGSLGIFWKRDNFRIAPYIGFSRGFRVALEVVEEGPDVELRAQYHCGSNTSGVLATEDGENLSWWFDTYV